uniref:Uncharacterized protein n=1 Tax=Tanacetum cinerariifolium TaxID=118510 RepID=A0A699K2S5_TANCI|nr:hypothetical protein [Tanacetum cinerariifolium]
MMLLSGGRKKSMHMLFVMLGREFTLHCISRLMLSCLEKPREQVDSLAIHVAAKCEVGSGKPTPYDPFFVALAITFSFKVVQGPCDGYGQWVKNDYVWKAIVKRPFSRLKTTKI